MTGTNTKINNNKKSDKQTKKLKQQDYVHMNTESVQCISIVYSICPYKYNQ